MENTMTDSDFSTRERDADFAGYRDVAPGCSGTPRLFAMNGSEDFGWRVARRLGIPLSQKVEFRHPDSEAYCASRVNVRRRRCYVIGSLDASDGQTTDDKKEVMTGFIHTLKLASAAEVIVCAPMLNYGRQDQKDRPRAPVLTQKIAMDFEGCGCDRVITMDVHSLAACQNAFRHCAFDNLQAKWYLLRAAVEYVRDVEQVIVATPDIGGSKRAKEGQVALSQLLKRQVGFAQGDKTRYGDEDVEISNIIFNPRFPIKEGVAVIPLDDVFASCRTLKEFVKGVRSLGGYVPCAIASFGMFTGSAHQQLDELGSSCPDLIVSDAVSPYRLQASPYFKKVRQVSVAPIFAGAISATENSGSINDLLQNPPV
jgi:ribose-phosphate pyrophosphokinase